MTQVTHRLRRNERLLLTEGETGAGWRRTAAGHVAPWETRCCHPNVLLMSFPAAHRSAVLHHYYCCSEAFFRSLQQRYHENESALQPGALSSPRPSFQETLKNYSAEGGTIQAVFLGHSRDP